MTIRKRPAPAKDRPSRNHTNTADSNSPVRCARCKRRLFAVVSVSLRIGPVCHRKLMAVV